MAVTPQSLEEASARLESEAPGYLARVRRQAAALARPATEKERARRAISTAVQAAQVTPNVPVASNRLVGRLLKRVIATMVRFYVLHVTSQVVEFADASAWMGQALLEYTESLEKQVASLQDHVRGLEQNVRGLEEAVRCLEEGAGAS